MRLFTLVVVLILSLPTVALSGQIPEGMEGAFRPHPEADKAISELRSPFCPTMLGVCPAAQSVALRDSIQALAYEGWTSDELVEWMLGNYGEVYRAFPQRSGWGMWAWLLPPLGLLFGVGAVVLVLRRSGAGRKDGEEEEGSAEVPALTGEEEDRLRTAIRDLEMSEDPSF